MKYLLLIGLVFFALWLFGPFRKRRLANSSSRPAAAESMVECAFCKVYQPVSECVVSRGRYYCCAAHRRVAEQSGQGS